MVRHTEVEEDDSRNSGDPVTKRVTNAVLYLLVSFIGIALVAFVSFVFTKNSEQDETLVKLDTTQKIVVKTLEQITGNQQSMIVDLSIIKGKMEQLVRQDDKYSRVVP